MANEKRLIDKEPIKKFIVDGLNNPNRMKAFGHDAIEILTEIEYAPTVDAVEVVRCKDCKHMEVTPYNLRLCNVWDSINGMGDDGFCNYGERRDGE